MADKTIDSNLISLINRWGVAPQANFDIPKDGFAGDELHNVATDRRGVGTCVQVKHPGVAGVAGYSQFMYFQWVANVDVAITAKIICVPDSATLPFVVTNDPDHCVNANTGRCAVAISSMTTTYYGWGWVGGVCPEDLVATLCDDFPTDSTVVAGFFKTVKLTADAIGFASAETTGTGASTKMALACGFAQAADAA
jgi:hypothetical protein